MSKYLEATVTVMTDRNATVAEVDLITDVSRNEAFGVYSPTVVSATGSAKRDPADKNDETIGTELAVGRALESLGRKLQRRANGQVSAASEAKRVKVEAKAERECRKALDDYYVSLLSAFGLTEIR